jgi:hypothetical protein
MKLNLTATLSLAGTGLPWLQSQLKPFALFPRTEAPLTCAGASRKGTGSERGLKAAVERV